MSKKFYKILFVIVIVSMFLFALANSVFAVKEVTLEEFATGLLDCTNFKYFRNTMLYEVKMSSNGANGITVNMQQGGMEESIIDLTYADGFVSTVYPAGNYTASLQYKIMQDVAEYAIKNSGEAIPATQEELEAKINSSITAVPGESSTTLKVNIGTYGINIKTVDTNNSYSKNTTNTVQNKTTETRKIPAAGLNVGLIKVCSGIIALSVLAMIIYTIKNKSKK